MKTEIVFLALVLAASAPAQTTGNTATNTPAPAVPTIKPGPALPAAKGTTETTSRQSPATPSNVVVKTPGPELISTNTPPAFSDAQGPPEVGTSALQRLDRSLEPVAGSRRRVSPGDQTRETGPQHGVALDGVAIKAVTLGNPLQLINPFAPAEYGWGADTLVPAVSRHTDGIAFFSLRF